MTPDLSITAAGRKLGLVRGGFAILLVGCAVLGYGAYDYQQQSDALQGATTVNATVTETGIEQLPQRRGSPDYRPTVTYEYRYEGTSYTSHNVYPGSAGPRFETRSDAEAELGAYENGSVVTAYVQPDAPGESYLAQQRTDAPLKLVGMGGLFVLVGLGSVLKSFLGG
ncbi:DUF3592 domain-containing protein [Haloarchaeobius salinus]|uniref:DUF3592 domain-containing protein n=1 Tax=Haloarchaeobius salinus TaxID=1198298 RepID=UPI00210D7D19|nr:DUF3592 domain-containing protein [Haloarchaeobius salinus]